MRALACRASSGVSVLLKGCRRLVMPPARTHARLSARSLPPKGVVFNQHKITLMNPPGVRQWNVLVALRGWVGLAEPGGRARRYGLAVLRCPPASWLLSTFEACRVRCCCDSEQDSS